MSTKRALERLCAVYGIDTHYVDVWGKRHTVAAGTLRALLQSMGVAAGRGADLEAAAARAEAAGWHRLLAPVQVLRAPTEPPTVMLSVPAEHGERVHAWRLELEGGESHAGRFTPAALECLEEARVEGTAYRRHALVLPVAPASGYHRLTVVPADDAAAACSMALIAAPPGCYRPEALGGDGRIWGPALQLYALRSERNWGMGDLGDLRTALEVASELGADMVGVNPLHALFPHDPERASPYSPSSRLFLNVLYLDVEATEDFAGCEAARRAVADPQFQAHIRALRARELVDYTAVAELKGRVLELVYRHFREQHLERGTGRAQAFRAFQDAGGEDLRRQALFEVLQAHFHGEDRRVGGWRDWPEAYRDPASPEVAAFAEAQRPRLEFYQYLQWQLEQQLAAVGRRSLELGLGVGLYLDLAVSVDGGGAEAWGHQTLYAPGVRVGAPPDDFSRKGQDWGLPPWNPVRLREAAYAPFIATLRASMRHAGALRIDHVMGLMRLYWIPPGAGADQGAYVSYPLEDLLGIVALESQRNRCLVVGEDLGTVPENLGQTLQALGVLSYRVFYFEKDEGGGFRTPAACPEQALVAASTHDLPTLAGYWRGEDLDAREALGLLPSPAVRDAMLVERAADRARLLLALEREELLPADLSAHPISAPAMSPALTRAVYQYLARAPSWMLAVQMEDVFGQEQQVNMPGTDRPQYPNWRRKLGLNLEDWLADPAVQALAGDLVHERGAARRRTAVRPVSAPARPGGARIPGATYRLQFHAGFTFRDATAIVPYLAALGVTHCYASPYLKARPGSTHGYDIIDHNAINPEIGSGEDFQGFCAALRQHGLSQILDIVPNHMGVMGSDNAWWLDVLENGRASVHADYFDIDWQSFGPVPGGKVLIALLGEHYGVVLENGELKLALDPEAGAFAVEYYEHRFPVDPARYGVILGHRLETLQARMGAESAEFLEFQSLVTTFGHLPGRDETAAQHVAERARDKEVHKRHLAELIRRSPDIAWFVDENLAWFNGKPGEARSFDALHELLQDQAYWLAYWRVAADDINYRRFFDINSLAGLRMEREAVFADTHRLVLDLVANGTLDGLRIDHPDGLYDPVDYFRRLQSTLPRPPEAEADERPLYVVVEKILESYERLPEHWPVHGTTGYEFANLVNGVLVDARRGEALESIYRDFTGLHLEHETLLHGCKRLIMEVSLASELNVLASQLHRIARMERRTQDFTLRGLHTALTAVVACFPVYRTYVDGGPLARDDRRYVDWAVSVARKHSHGSDSDIFDFVRDVLLGLAAEGKGDAYREAVLAFAMKFQQYSGPVMAKGLEDTAFYRYNRLVSLNEVGGDPWRFGLSVNAFHHANQERLQRWPHAMLNTSTHDSKRSEDVRVRITALSEIPEEWQRHLQRWGRLNARKRRQVNELPAPDRNEEYLLYQILLGVLPFGELDADAWRDVMERVQAYMLKAGREAKEHSSWVNPDPDYEKAVADFIQDLLETPERNPFLADFLPFQRRIARLGIYNGLAQVALKLTVPGVPDIYQGNELWDLSLVDPDNRRPVDFHRRRALLETLTALDGIPDGELAGRVRSLLDAPEDGQAKLYLSWRALQQRRRHPELFATGAYLPLTARGWRAEHVIAFARRQGKQTLVVIVPRLPAALLGRGEERPLGRGVWGDTTLELPAELAGGYRDVLSGERLACPDGTLAVAAALAHFPVALLGDAG